jgi:hypothetical protein
VVPDDVEVAMTDERSTDPVMDRITAAVERSRSGDRSSARADLAALWDEIGPDGDPFHRCTLAHYAADVQDDLRAELAWDEVALEAAGQVSDARAKEHHESLAIEGFLPSLHLNLAEDHRRLGDAASARHHIEEARRRLSALPEDGYGAMIRAGVDRVAALLEGP